MFQRSFASPRLAILLVIAAGGGLVASEIGIPLAWMVGPMLAAAALSLAGWTAPVPRALRSTGQVIVAAAVGLYFTPDALAAMASQAPYMIGAALATIVAGCASAPLLMRMARVDSATALYAGIPGGPVEMAQMAEQAGGDGASVALAQTLRIAAIVIVIPPAILWMSGETELVLLGSRTGVSALGLMGLMALAAGAGIVFRRLRLANPFFLGPLALSVLLAATDVHLSSVPPWLLSAGQVLLGVSLGIRFDRPLLRRAPRFLAAAVVTTGFLLGCCTAVAWVISRLADQPFAEMVLALAPGSVTEMALTAKGLDLGVAAVTAYHITRIFIIIPLSPYLLRVMLRRARREDPAEMTGD